MNSQRKLGSTTTLGESARPPIPNSRSKSKNKKKKSTSKQKGSDFVHERSK